ncbi:hypothetical protein KCP70_22395 [Salmonella enterica subsp. enterica]|nr:hypothetical protein KCP70_22395 [Salmonella enterica subsp. enterica]
MLTNAPEDGVLFVRPPQSRYSATPLYPISPKNVLVSRPRRQSPGITPRHIWGINARVVPEIGLPTHHRYRLYSDSAH